MGMLARRSAHYWRARECQQVRCGKAVAIAVGEATRLGCISIAADPLLRRPSTSSSFSSSSSSRLGQIEGKDKDRGGHWVFGLTASQVLSLILSASVPTATVLRHDCHFGQAC